LKSKDKKCILIGLLSFGAVLCPLLFCSDALAAEELTPGRRLWDNIMLVVNFLVLVFFFVKYAKKPLMDYLRGERRKMEENLNTIDGRLKEAKSGIEKEFGRLKDIEERIKEIQESVIEMGKREKDKIIDEAKIVAQKMIQDAKDYSNYRLAMAEKALSDEMVDIAISLVEQRLVKGISQEDNERLTEEFIHNLGAAKRHFD
jgi:F-type H+-transporting ATPase subunit b